VILIISVFSVTIGMESNCILQPLKQNLSPHFIPSFLLLISFPVSTVTAPVVAPTPVPAPVAESSASSFSTSFQHSSVPEEEYKERVSKLRKVLVEGNLLTYQLSFLLYSARCCCCCCCFCYKERFNVSCLTFNTFGDAHLSQILLSPPYFPLYPTTSFSL
jgi:hypothetical protein